MIEARYVVHVFGSRGALAQYLGVSEKAVGGWIERKLMPVVMARRLRQRFPGIDRLLVDIMTAERHGQPPPLQRRRTDPDYVAIPAATEGAAQAEGSAPKRRRGRPRIEEEKSVGQGEGDPPARELQAAA